MQFFDLVIIGGGVAGISAAVQAKESGINSVLIIEKEHELGGNLNQCIHSGYGVQVFGEDLTGPELVQKLIDNAIRLKIQFKLNTTVLDLSKDKTLTAVNSEDGVFQVNWKVLVYAAGCIENTRNAIKIAGSEAAGIYTAGEVQKIINIDGFLPGKEVVVIGSEDLGLIMAGRVVIEGATVKAVIEKSPEVRGNKKNTEENLEDFNIPLLLSHEVIKIKGNARVEQVTVVRVDGNRAAIAGTEMDIACDTVIISVELVPKYDLLENAEIKALGGVLTDCDGIFICGDASFIHKNADSIINEGKEAGIAAYEYLSEINEF